MPIYEYACKKCDTNFELLLSKRDENAQCPQCGSKILERQLSTFGVSSQSPASACMDGACEMPAPGVCCGQSKCAMN